MNLAEILEGTFIDGSDLVLDKEMGLPCLLSKCHSFVSILVKLHFFFLILDLSKLIIFKIE
jgi:hypothetical protein